jgi:hypothetical protein
MELLEQGSPNSAQSNPHVLLIVFIHGYCALSGQVKPFDISRPVSKGMIRRLGISLRDYSIFFRKPFKEQ